MKLKILGLIIFAITLSQGADSQISFGGYGGLVSAKFVGDPPPKGFYDWGYGWQAGVRLEVPLSEALLLSTQPSFIQQNLKYLITDWKGVKLDSLNIEVNGLSVPIGLIIQSENNKFYAYTGFEINTPILAKSSNANRSNEFTDKLRKVNVAFQFAAGYRIPIGGLHLYFELRYSQFILNTTYSNTNFENLDRVKIQGVRLNTGLQIPLKKKNEEND